MRPKYNSIRHVSILALGVALGSSLPQIAAAQEETTATVLPTIYYSVSQAPVTTGSTGVSVTQLDANAIAQSTSRSLPQLLATQPGVSMTQEGGIGAPATLRIRGLGGGYFATRMDGIDISDPAGTRLYYNFGLATTLGLDRIEVLRGSQSAIHGSEAIGGVVDMATFRPEVDGFSGRNTVEIATYETVNAATSLGWRGNGTELALTYARTITEGFSAMSDNDEADGLDTAFLSYHIAQDLSDTLRIGVNGHVRDNREEYDDEYSREPLGNRAETTSDAWRVFADIDLGATSHSLSYSGLNIDRTAYPASYTTDGSRRELQYTGHWERDDALSLHWGYEQSKEGYRGDYDEGTARTDAIFGEALIAATDDLDISIALRMLDHNSFGNFTTGRVAAAYRPTDDWVLRTALATGVTMPSPYQRYSEYGHAGIRPETSKSVEFGAEYLWGANNSVQLTYFDITVTDRIDYVEGPGDCANGSSERPGCYTQIPGDTRTNGIELSATIALSDLWQLTGNYTYTQAKTSDGDATTPLPRVPEHALSLALQGDVTDRIGASIGLRHIAGLKDTGDVDMDDHTLVDLGAEYALSDNAALYLQVQNAFDTDYTTLTGYNQPGRQILVGLRTTF